MRKNWKKYVLAALISLFLQLLHWLIYQWTAFPAGLLAVTPLLLCACYHVYQSDTAKNRGMGRLAVFLCSVLVPFLLCALVSGGMFLRHPNLYLYHQNVMPSGGKTEVLALYAGRMWITSFYLLVFSGVDVLLLRWQDRHRQRKAMEGGK